MRANGFKKALILFLAFEDLAILSQSIDGPEEFEDVTISTMSPFWST